MAVAVATARAVAAAVASPLPQTCAMAAAVAVVVADVHSSMLAELDLATAVTEPVEWIWSAQP